MTLFLEQREPGPAAIKKAIDSLIAGLNARHPGYRWTVVSWPDALRDQADPEEDT